MYEVEQNPRNALKDLQFTIDRRKRHGSNVVSNIVFLPYVQHVYETRNNRQTLGEKRPLSTYASMVDNIKITIKKEKGCT